VVWGACGRAASARPCVARVASDEVAVVEARRVVAPAQQRGARVAELALGLETIELEPARAEKARN
jgi:hypothetical protein